MDIPSLFFERHPNPMLIFDTGMLKIIEVNKRAVEKYGRLDGEIQVESAPGEWTHYLITFPKTKKTGSSGKHFI